MSTDLIDVTAIRRQFDCRDVASRYVLLDPPPPWGNSRKEVHGPCPLCGGRDRFYVGPNVWGCRVCTHDGKKGGDVIRLIQLAENLDFMGAVEFLTKGTRTKRQVIRPSKLADERSFSEDDEAKRQRFLAHGPVIMDASHERLMSEDTPGGEYLLRRGLSLEVWHRFGLGYVDDACGKGPAVAMPWYRGGGLTAIRYRLLEPKSEQKIISETGSELAGLLFGGQAMLAPIKHANGKDDAAGRTLILVEGEINGMSIWQEMSGTPVDVLSFGAEGTRVTPAIVGLAARYRAVIVWMDEEWFARDRGRLVNGLVYWSTSGGTLKPDGKHTEGGRKLDANDHLCAGRLHEIMAHLWSKATPKAHAEALAAEMAAWIDGMWLDLKAAQLEAERE